MSTDRITCLVPTHRRPRFLRRFLRFYAQFPPGFRIVVVDSSDADLAAENARIVADARAAGLPVEHLVIDLDFIGKCLRALEGVESPFVTLCADDDLQFPDAIRRCADFLEREPSYCSAQGRTALVYPERSRFGCMRLKGYSIEDDLPFERCCRLAESFFSNFYSVYRTGTLRENFRLTAAHTDSRLTYTVPEMMLSQLSALRGKIKVLPVMQLLMERHPSNAGVLGRTGVRSQAEELYQRFKAGLADEFIKAGIDRSVAETYLDTSFGYFREPSLKHRRRRRSVAEAIGHLVRSTKERIEDRLQDHQVRHRRLVRASDYAGHEVIWEAAVRLMREHPQGIAAAPPSASVPA